MSDSSEEYGLHEPCYPFENHFLSLDGLDYHYLDEGDGPPAVMVHGNPTWSIYYRNLVLALRGTHRCIVPDHIGCGLSDKPDDNRYHYTLSRRVDDLEALLDSLGIRENISLIVHDWGGMIGMAYAARHPERIARFVIMNTACGHLPASKRFPRALALVRTPLGALLVRGLNAFARTASHVCCKRTRMSWALRSAYCRPYDSWKNRIATLRFVQDIPLSPEVPSYAVVSQVQESLPRFVNRPMLIAWGMRDFVFSHHFLEDWAHNFPQAEIHRFEDAGHYILEDAAEDVIPLITEFLNR